MIAGSFNYWPAVLAAATLCLCLWGASTLLMPHHGNDDVKVPLYAREHVMAGSVWVSHGKHKERSSVHGFHEDDFEVYNCKAFLKDVPGSLPDFLVLGVHKGGSTALYSFLMFHGLIRPSACKETRFFSDEKLYSQGLEFYRKHFFNVDRVSPNDQEGQAREESPVKTLTGEGTPSYIRDPLATVRIAKTLPQAKLIVSLRDPVERFVSHYVGFYKRKLTKKSCTLFFNEAVAEIDRCVKHYSPSKHKVLPTTREVNEWEALRLATTPGSDVTSLDVTEKNFSTCARGNRGCARRHCLSTLHNNAIARSVYVDQLVRWLRYYAPSSIKLVQSERLHQHTEQVMQDVVGFLGLRNFSRQELDRFVNAEKGSNHHSSKLATKCNREIIREYFYKDNALLQKLLSAQWPDISHQWIPWPDANNH